MKTAAALLIFAAAHRIAAEIDIGSKRFTESYVLGEIATKVLRGADLAAEHRQGMGGTIILWEALKAGRSAHTPNTPARSPRRFSIPGSG